MNNKSYSDRKDTKTKYSDYIILNDENYVDIAKEVIESFKNKKDKDNIVTSTQLRNLLSMISDIYNDVVMPGSTNEPNNDILNSEIKKRINYLKVKCVYESGREKSVKEFIKKAKILEHLDNIGESKNNFILFSRYMEALVAYRKYFFEGDN